MKLSAHFSLEELTQTSTGLHNEPPEAVVERLRFGATEVLEPWRARVGPIGITSEGG